MINEYDEAKRMLNIIRKIQRENSFKLLKEQEDQNNNGIVGQDNNTSTLGNDSNDDSDFTIINDVEVVVHSDDAADLEIKEDEKGKISQIIDSFRTEVAEITEFGKLHIYDNSAKLEGKIGNLNMSFMLSAGDDEGSYLTNLSSLKITPETIDMVNKLKNFEPKFTNAINDIILARRSD